MCVLAPRNRAWLASRVSQSEAFMKAILLLMPFITLCLSGPNTALAEASGGRTEAGGAFMSSYRSAPPAFSTGPAAQPIRRANAPALEAAPTMTESAISARAAN
jgi:hypothetical protein